MATRALPTAPVFLAGQKLTAATLNQVMTYTTFWGADPPTVHAYQSVTQNLTNTTDAQIKLDSKLWDSDSAWQSSTPYNIVIPAGWGSGLRFTAEYATAFAINSTGARATYLKSNGTRILGSTRELAACNDFTIVGGKASFLASSGDTIQLWAWQNSGGTLATAVSPDTSFLALWLRGTGSP